MRSRVSLFTALFVVGLFALPHFVQAQQATVPFLGSIIPPNYDVCPLGWGMLIVVAQRIIALSITIAIVFVAPVMIAYSGFLYVVNPTNPSGVSKAHGILRTTIIGIIIAISAWAIVSTLMSAITGSSAWSSVIHGTMECLQQRGSLPADTLNQVAEKPVGSVAGVTSAPGAAVGSSGVSISSAVQALDANASANGTPTGYCARYVRQALAAGGLTSFDTNHPAAAKDYGPYLEKAGFSTVNQSGYTPQAGDVIVYQPTSASSQYGHIQMYDGKNWVSDWKQPRMVPGASYQSASYTIFRG